MKSMKRTTLMRLGGIGLIVAAIAIPVAANAAGGYGSPDLLGGVVSGLFGSSNSGSGNGGASATAAGGRTMNSIGNSGILSGNGANITGQAPVNIMCNGFAVLGNAAACQMLGNGNGGNDNGGYDNGGYDNGGGGHGGYGHGGHGHPPRHHPTPPPTSPPTRPPTNPPTHPPTTPPTTPPTSPTTPPTHPGSPTPTPSVSGTSGGSLPVTGAPSASIGFAGGGLLLAGGGLLFFARSGRRKSDERLSSGRGSRNRR